MYIVTHYCVLCDILFTICKAQLHVSATNVGHLQVVQTNYQSVIHASEGGCVRCKRGGISILDIVISRPSALSIYGA